MALKNAVYIILIFFLVFPAWSKDLSLEEAIGYGLENSDTVILKYNELQSAFYAKEAVKARGLPDITVQASASYLTNPPEGIKINKGAFGNSPSPNSEFPVAFPNQDYVIIPDPENTYFKITTTLTQPLFTWFKIENAVAIADLDYDIAGLNLNKTKEELKRDLKKAYYATLLSRESAALLEQSVIVMKEAVADREKKYKEGLINLQKLLESRKNLAQLQSKLIRAQEGYKSGIAAILFLTGLPGEEVVLVSGFREDLPGFEETDLMSGALSHSFELKSLLKKREQAETYVRIEEGGDIFKPDVSLIASFEVNGQRVPLVQSNWTDTWDHNFILTLGAQMKLYDGGKAGNSTEKAKKMLEMAQTGVSRAEKGLALQVRRTVQDVMTGYYDMLEKKASLGESEEKYRNAKVSYENDVLTREEERGARVLLYSVRIESVLSQFTYNNALADLEYLTGIDFPVGQE
ncbi:MAG: TolC family protein [Spirochaetales bacterium]|nr:TolC family protein [Spirochaetales bacterium]